MLEEISKLLAPWPFLQLVFVVSALGVGIFAIVRGVNKSKTEPVPKIDLEEAKAQWKALEQLGHLEENSTKIVEILAKIYDRLDNNAQQMSGLAAALHNATQWRRDKN